MCLDMLKCDTLSECMLIDEIECCICLECDIHIPELSEDLILSDILMKSESLLILVLV